MTLKGLVRPNKFKTYRVYVVLSTGMKGYRVLFVLIVLFVLYYIHCTLFKNTTFSTNFFSSTGNFQIWTKTERWVSKNFVLQCIWWYSSNTDTNYQLFYQPQCLDMNQVSFYPSPLNIHTHQRWRNGMVSVLLCLRWLQFRALKNGTEN